MRRLLLSIATAGVCTAAMAIPAKPGLIAYTQPDGTVINIQMIGDEHGHMIYSEDGHLLVDANGRLEYAQFNSDGMPAASGIMAKAGVEASGLHLYQQADLDKWSEKLASVRSERLEKAYKEVLGRKRTTRADEDAADEGPLVPMNFARCESTFPVLGEQKGLVILVEYTDIPFQYGDYDYFNRMLNQEGFSDHGSEGSARDWFIENSDGRFVPQFDVFGPVKLPNDRAYYGANDAYGNDMRAHEMAIDACLLLDGEIDFTQYDRDGDGIIDNVFIFYAGKGEHDSGIKNAVWPHSWDVAVGMPDEQFVFDGVQLNHYACTCEFPSGYKRADGIGTFVHEFSHVMGLPDLYVTSNSTAFTPGPWSVMDQGPYNNDRLTPPNYSSYEKVALGWIDFQPFKKGRIELPDLSTTNIAYAMPTEKENEFYFFENRQQKGNDAYLPGHGMLVWHVDYRESIWRMNTVNNVANHQYVDIVEADNNKSASSRQADTFPGTKNVTSFGFGTKPQLASWAKQPLEFDLEDITESEDGVISFTAVPYGSNAVDAIESVGKEDNVYYDLMGRRVANPQKGIYIHNGKKVIL